MRFDLQRKDTTRFLRSCTGRNYYGSEFIVGIANDKLVRIMDARFYCTSSGTAYCRVWFHIPTQWGYGTGRAGGYGYDKASAALYEACERAGVSFNGDEDFAGRGIGYACSLLLRGLEQATGQTLYHISAGA